MRVCSVSVDLDEIHHYLAIHGVPDLDVHQHAVYDVAVPRLLDWARARQLPLTLFAVGADLSREENRSVLTRAVAAGHEIGNHSFSHAYDLTRLAKEREIGRASCRERV